MTSQAKSASAFVSNQRVLWASLAGTSIEFYDFYIYATAASLVFGPLFFPSTSPSAQLMSAYATFSLAFIARPLGAIVFGHFGDHIGRKSTLVASLLLMGVSTVAIAFLPTFETAGWLAPFALCVLRFGQGFGLGGEWGGAALLAVENAPAGYRGRFGMVPQLGAPLGFIFANGLFLVLGLVLTQQQYIAWGWRLPFMASAVLVAMGLWIRLKLTETPAFAAALAEAPPPRVPLADVLREYPREVIGGIFGVVATFAIFYITTAFALGYGTTTLGYPRETFLAVQLGSILFMAFGIVLSGALSDRFDERRVLMFACGGAALIGFLLAPMMGSGSLAITGAFLSGALVFMGMTYGPLGAWLPGLFPARVRYTGASIAFNVGGILGGALTPIVAQTLATHGGLVNVGYYLSATGLISFIVLLALKRRAA